MPSHFTKQTERQLIFSHSGCPLTHEITFCMGILSLTVFFLISFICVILVNTDCALWLTTGCKKTDIKHFPTILCNQLYSRSQVCLAEMPKTAENGLYVGWKWRQLNPNSYILNSKVQFSPIGYIFIILFFSCFTSFLFGWPGLSDGSYSTLT